MRFGGSMAAGKARWPRRVAIVVAVLVALPLLLAALLAALVAVMDWNLAKPWLARQLSAALAREIRVDGPISLSWSMPAPMAQSVASFVPQLHFTAQDLLIGNPAWAHSSGHLARAHRLDLHFSPFSLVRWHWRITDLRVDGLDLVMERLDDQHKNWRFSDQPRSRWSFDIHQIVFAQAAIRYVDRPLDLDLRFDAHPLGSEDNRAARHQPGDDPALVLQATVSGRYAQAPVRGQLRGGALPDLLNEGSVYPLQAEGEIGEVHTVIAGRLFNPHQLSHAELQLRLSGASLDRLYPATGVPLPATRPFTTEGKLSIVRVDRETKAWNWRYAQFTGKVGESDFAGDAEYYRGPPKNHLTVQARAGLLRLSDYLPGQGKDEAGKDKGKLLSQRPAQPERWARLDADISLQARRVLLQERQQGQQGEGGLEWQDATTTLRLKDQVLSAAPLRFSMAGGKGEGEVSLDGRSPDIRARLQLKLQDVQVRQLFPRLASLDASFGKLDGQATLSGSGNSVAAMLASADGEIKADLSQGTISQFILEAAGLNLANAVFARMYRDQQVRLLCGAADVSIKDGLARVRHGILNTEDAAIDVSGQVDLGKESLALNIYPRTKQVRILSLRTPLYVRGSFAKPDIGASKEGLAARAGAAAALALVAPVAAVIPLITPGQKIPDDCAPSAPPSAP